MSFESTQMDELRSTIDELKSEKELMSSWHENIENFGIDNKYMANGLAVYKLFAKYANEHGILYLNGGERSEYFLSKYLTRLLVSVLNIDEKVGDSYLYDLIDSTVQLLFEESLDESDHYKEPNGTYDSYKMERVSKMMFKVRSFMGYVYEKYPQLKGQSDMTRYAALYLVDAGSDVLYNKEFVKLIDAIRNIRRTDGSYDDFTKKFHNGINVMCMSHFYSIRASSMNDISNHNWRCADVKRIVEKSHKNLVEEIQSLKILEGSIDGADFIENLTEYCNFIFDDIAVVRCDVTDKRPNSLDKFYHEEWIRDF